MPRAANGQWSAAATPTIHHCVCAYFFRRSQLTHSYTSKRCWALVRMCACILSYISADLMTWKLYLTRCCLLWAALCAHCCCCCRISLGISFISQLLTCVCIILACFSCSCPAATKHFFNLALDAQDVLLSPQPTASRKDERMWNMKHLELL